MRPKDMTPSRTAVALTVVTAATAGAFGLTLLPGASPVAHATGLTPYDSCAQLLGAYRGRLVAAATAYPSYGGLRTAAPTAQGAAEGDAAKAVGTSGTGTNVQEAGVDEPDSAKLAGDVLVASSGNTVQLVSPGPAPRLLGVVRLGSQAYGAQLLVDGTRVLALTQTWGQPTTQAAASDVRIGMPYGGVEKTVAILVDISDPRRPRVLETSTTDGRLVSARLAGGRVRLVLSSPARPETVPPVYDGKGPVSERPALLANRRLAAATPLDRVLPQRERRSGQGVVLEKGPAVRCDEVSYPTGGGGTTTLTVTTLDLQDSLAPTGTAGVNADGDLVYASSTTVYVASSRWGTTAKAIDAPDNDEVSTQLHAFAMTEDSADYRASGSVPGYLLNSYSLSEHEGHLRVVTTRQPPWATQDGVAVAPAQRGTSASLLVLRDDGAGELVAIGRVDGLGKGEQVYAVRFLGDLATVVTFRQTDPLYTLDLATPTAPEVLGELKIPGFSNYLHPIGGDALVGLGQDADLQGRVTGLQLATFDLSDLRAPSRTHVLDLGPGWSEAAHDPHAFVFTPALSLLTVPVSDERGVSSLLGVRVTASGLTEVGRLSDPTGSALRRAFVIDGRVVAVSETGVVAGTAQLEPTGSVRFAS